MVGFLFLRDHEMNRTKYLSPSQLAKQLDLSTKTVYAWIQSGRVLSSTLPNGRYRIPSEELDRLLTGVDHEQRPGGSIDQHVRGTHGKP